MPMPKPLVFFAPLMLAACASTTPIQLAASSRSQFADAVYSGQTAVLDKPTPGEEQYRVFQQAATGFVPIDSVRSDVEGLASVYCERKGKTMHGLEETDAKPPYILGNFPRVELLFECISKSPSAKNAAQPSAGKYEKLVTLKKLLDEGALTPQEFEREKAKVLGEP